MRRAASSAEVERFFSEAIEGSRKPSSEPLHTDFAITTLNLPDRLDAQSLSALQDDGYRRASRFSISRSGALRWLRRFLAYGLVVALVGVAWLAYEAVSADVGTEAIVARISSATGMSTTLAKREFTWRSGPGIVLRDLRIGSRFRADRVHIHFSWDSLSRASRWRGVLPEASVSPMTLSAEQGIELAGLARAMDARSGLGVGAVRFESVRLLDMPVLLGEYEIVLRRQPEGNVAPLEMRRLGVDGEMLLRAQSDEPGVLRFELNAQRWAAPWGPPVIWDSLLAQGRVWSRGVVVESFSGKVAAGQVEGSWAAASDVQWSFAASMTSNDADVAAAIEALVTPGDPSALRSPLSGRANFNVLGSGHGQSLAAAVERSAFIGQASSPSLTLAGVNLGVVAAQEGSLRAAGGSTRLGEVSAVVQWSRDGVSIRDIRSQSGGMVTRGQIAISPGLRLAGVLTVDLSAVLPQSRPAVMQVGGNLFDPTFSRL